MDNIRFEAMVCGIVRDAILLKDKHTSEKKAIAEYACIFSQSNAEYEELLRAAKKMGNVIKDTPTGQVFLVNPIETDAGRVMLVKIRLPDAARPERGDADFRVEDYNRFKERCLRKKGFNLITREGFEMVELIDPRFNVRAYFSNPPVSVQYGLRK